MKKLSDVKPKTGNRTASAVFSKRIAFSNPVFKLLGTKKFDPRVNDSEH